MRLVISPGAQRDLRKLPRDALQRVAATIDELAREARARGCLLLGNYEPPTWRVRVGDWRVLYEVSDEARIVTVVGVRHRSRAY